MPSTKQGLEDRIQALYNARKVCSDVAVEEIDADIDDLEEQLLDLHAIEEEDNAETR